MKKQESKFATLWKEDDSDVIFASYAPKLDVTLDIAKELVENRMEFSEGKDHFVVIDFSNIKSVTKEARDYMNDPKGGLAGIRGGAFLSSNVVSTLLINLYLKINKPVIPSKFFTDRKEALKWLNGIIQEQVVKH